MADGYIGAPDRALSYRINTWEWVNARATANYTYYVPVDARLLRLLRNPFDVVVLGREQCRADLRPEVWITTPGAPLVKRRLTLERLEKD